MEPMIRLMGSEGVGSGVGCGVGSGVGSAVGVGVGCGVATGVCSGAVVAEAGPADSPTQPLKTEKSSNNTKKNAIVRNDVVLFT
jgi:hypothetical protein